MKAIGATGKQMRRVKGRGHKLYYIYDQSFFFSWLIKRSNKAENELPRYI